jgi:hypothetical protein
VWGNTIVKGIIGGIIEARDNKVKENRGEDNWQRGTIYGRDNRVEE